MKKVAATVLCILAVTAIVSSSGLPNHWRDYLRNKFEMAQTQQVNNVCAAVAPASVVCQSARLTVGGTHSHVHVCPDNGKICFNSLLPRCCAPDVERGFLKCVSSTKLTVAGQRVTVGIYEAADSSGHCFHFDANIEINSCCPDSKNRVLECQQDPDPPKRCVPKRDVFFVLDATQSIGDDVFCRFGYVLQLIEAAINPRGLNGARVATVLFENSPELVTADYLFNLEDICSAVVSTNIPRVVYEYHAVHRGLPHGRLTYPQVNSRSTKPISALIKVERSIVRDRPASVIILTDGKPQQSINDIRRIRDQISAKGNVLLIAAGIGSKDDIDKTVLSELVSDSANVIYEADTGKVISFAERIIQRMNRTGALCPSEAASILDALSKANVGGTIENYCTKCMWTATPDSTCPFPTCGAQNLEMQAATSEVWLKPEVNAEHLVAMELEKKLLEKEIVSEIQELMGKISRG